MNGGGGGRGTVAVAVVEVEGGRGSSSCVSVGEFSTKLEDFLFEFVEVAAGGEVGRVSRG